MLRWSDELARLRFLPEEPERSEGASTDGAERRSVQNPATRVEILKSKNKSRTKTEPDKTAQSRRAPYARHCVDRGGVPPNNNLNACGR